MADIEIDSTPVAYAAGDRFVTLRGAGSGVPITTSPVGDAFAAATRDALAALTTTSRLPATAIKDLPSFKEPLWGNGAPTAAVGKDGDTYIDGVGGAIYGPKAAGVWPATPLPIAGTSGGDVASVNGYTGAVVLGKADIGLTNADNTSDADKPVSTATQAALDLKAATSHGHLLDDLSDLGTFGETLSRTATPEEALESLGYVDAPAEWVPGYVVLIDNGIDEPYFGNESYSDAFGNIVATVAADGPADVAVAADFNLIWSASSRAWIRTLTAATIEIPSFEGIPLGGDAKLIIVQDATGSRELTWGAAFSAYFTGADLAANQTANARTVYFIMNNGATTLQVQRMDWE